MTSIRVRYFSILVGHAGIRAEDVILPDGSTLAHLLEALTVHKPATFQATLLPQGRLSPMVRLIHNQRPVEADSLNAVLADGDELLLFPVVSGG
jgi:molybdopterin converting factor small subunit